MPGLELFLASLLLAPGAAAVSAPPLPAAVKTYVGEFDTLCRDAGGKPGKHDPAMIQRGDFNGDGVADYVVNIGGYNCDGAASAIDNGQSGAAVAVFAGGTSKAWSGSAYGASIEGGKLYLDTAGLDCGQRNAASVPFSELKACSRPLVWNAASKKFVWGPLSQARQAK